MPTTTPPTLITFYNHLTNHIVPGPQSLSYFATLILLPIALLIPRSVLSKWQSVAVFVPVMVGCTVHAWWAMGGVDVISVETLLRALFLLVLRDPWRDFRRVGGRDGGGNREVAKAGVGTGVPAVTGAGRGGVDDQQPAFTTSHNTNAAPAVESDDKAPPRSHAREQPYPASSFWQRLPWVSVLIVSIRLNTWRIASPSHDRTQPPPPAFRTRTAFLRHALTCFVRGYLVLDLTRAYIATDPYFTDPGIAISSPLPSHLGMMLRFVPAQLFRTMVIGAQTWALISQMFYLPCLLPVGLHALHLLPADEWSPHTWPSYFGLPSAIFLHGVRGFWGTYWHQTMRYSVSGPGYAIADSLRLRPRGLARYALITITAFALSGYIHMGLVPPFPLHSTLPVNSIRLCVAGFFWLQPVAMLLEMAGVRLIVGLTGSYTWQYGWGRWVRMLVNGVWVVTWFTLTLPLLGEAGRQMGYWRVWPVPVSLWRGVRGEGWVVWPVLNS